MFPAAVERWRPEILRYVPNPAGGVDYWLAWLLRESGGNICSYTSLRESGLFQLMPPDNTSAGGTTEAALRAACSGSSLARQPTAAEIREQMVSFQRYLAYIIDRATQKLAAAGVTWSKDSPDFWKMVKFQHTLPGPTAAWLTMATKALGRPPASWAEMVPYASMAGIPAKWVENASWVGSFGRGGGEIPVVLAAIAVGSAVMYYLWRKRRR